VEPETTQDSPREGTEGRPPAAEGVRPDAAEARLVAAAPRFELAALLRALAARGHSWETISFEGVRELTSAPGLVHSLRFAGRAPRRAVVRLNLGLLGPNGALPSYFQRFAHSLRDPRPFLSFIRFFDDVLLRNHAWLTCPGEGIAASGGLRAAYRTTAGFASTPRLHWLFRAMVPELPVTVTATAFTGDQPGAGAHLTAAAPATGRAGAAAVSASASAPAPAHLDGSAVLGPAYRITRRGFVVRLYAEDETDDAGRSWEDELTRRYRERIAPLLGRLRRPLEVRICFERYRQGATLSPTSQVGHRRIRTKDPEAWEVVIAPARAG
jgi:hypothetical protein